ncbi:Protein of unknown function (DUF760 [Striga hermonthica]|uniref:Uncharacterized protein n=1 Tax=Striga hermonthica TaxID=68872 RepID=A0A9N7NXJ4_STRHE|nr:Protein of unknown function (DUF760 [Striga hermonthica]
MDCCFSYFKPKFPTLPVGSIRGPIAFQNRFNRRPLPIVASSRCQFGGLAAPLEPRTPTGRFLSGMLLDGRDGFQAAARKELQRLAAERDEAATRLQLSIGSDEACLHRRIAECKKHECQEAVEDVIYTLILHKFSEIRVHLVPKLSECLYNGRLEIWPSKDWELESIHSCEVLQMVRDHITAAVGQRADANVTASWATAEVHRSHLCKLYASSIFYGYLLKSIAFRHYLERDLDVSSSYLGFGTWTQVSEMFSIGSKQIAYNMGPTGFSSGARLPCDLGKNVGNLRIYMMGFDVEMIGMCANPRFKESVSLVGRHSRALFGDEEADVIKTSFASVKRFLLEAVAFGSFLWDVETRVNSEYVLEED